MAAERTRSRQLRLPPPITPRVPEYTVHLGVFGTRNADGGKVPVLIADGLLLGPPSICARFKSRASARAEATRLVREGARMAEVRFDWALLDTYALRGHSPRHIYSASQEASA